jgi:hypothetical protein
MLAANLDWSTFQLTEIAFGDHFIPIPANTQHFTTVEKMSYNNISFEVHIEAGIHPGTGQVYAKLQSIDPITGLPPAVAIGFLPPENGTGRGQGHISYLIRQKTGVSTGTEVRNVAQIVFDGQPPIATNQVDPHDPTKGTDPAKEAPITTWSGSFPLVTTGTATGIIETSATLNGTVNPSGYATTVQFEYGLTTAYGFTVGVTLYPNNGTISQNVSAAITGLQPGKFYHYRLAAINSFDTWYGNDATFTVPNVAPTLTSLAITGPATVIVTGTATYTAKATWSDGATSSINPTWSLTPTTYASINSSTGVLITLVVPSAQNITVSAVYTSGGISKTATKNVIIITKPGDCDGDGKVTIAEVQAAINMYLGLKTPSACVDLNGDGVSIDEVQKVINGYLGL